MTVFQKKILGALSVGHILVCMISSLLPSQNYFLKTWKMNHKGGKKWQTRYVC